MRPTDGVCLSAIFVDYDNIYLSLKRRDEEAAKRFAKESASWLKEIGEGRLLTPTNGDNPAAGRRIVMSRCYGNPVPRRNSRDNSTDMNSFPFVRHHFLRAGFEVIDCPPLTAQLKNSADIRIVMDIRDLLEHETRFDEFIILSSDADFTPLLHRLRAHARRTAIFANDHTASPYTALCDSEVREVDLVQFLLTGAPAARALPPPGPPLGLPAAAVPAVLAEASRVPEPAAASISATAAPSYATEARSAASGSKGEAWSLSPPASQAASVTRRPATAAEILDIVIAEVRAAGQPVPIETLADASVRLLGPDRTSGANWAGYGSFRQLLAASLPDGLSISSQPPYVVSETTRRLTGGGGRVAETRRAGEAFDEEQYGRPGPVGERIGADPSAGRPSRAGGAGPEAHRQGTLSSPASAANLQRSITAIHDASQAPPLAPPEYRKLFEILAEEISYNRFNGNETVLAVEHRSRESGLTTKRDDIRFIIDVVREADPYFEQGVSSQIFAGRFRNFVIARCRGQGLQLSADEIDLIDAWFMGAGNRISGSRAQPASGSVPDMPATTSQASGAERWSPADNQHRARQGMVVEQGYTDSARETPLPRIIRSRARM
jgi:hypothetical protein